MVAGRKIETAKLVQLLRDFIREVLDLDAVPADLVLTRRRLTPMQCRSRTRITRSRA